MSDRSTVVSSFRRVVTPSAAMALVLLAACGGSDSTSPPIVPPDPAVVGSAGGTVTTDDGRVQVAVPAGAVASNVRIVATPDAGATTDPSVGAAWTFGPTGTQFAVPVTMRLRFPENAFPDGTDLTRLQLARLENGRWVPRGEEVSVNATTREVTGKVRSFSSWAVWSDPCVPLALGFGILQGNTALTTNSCRFESAEVRRYSRYFTITAVDPTTSLELRWNADYPFVAGLKEATTDPAVGTVWASISAPTGGQFVSLGVILPAGTYQLFFSGVDTTHVGPFGYGAEARSIEALMSGGGCARRSAIVPGASFTTGRLDAVTGDCETTIQFNPDPRWIGRPLVIERFAARLLQGRRYTVTANFGASAAVNALTVFRDGAVAGQSFPDGQGTATLTLTPSTTGNYLIEVSAANPLGTDGAVPAVSYGLSLIDVGPAS